MDSCPQIGMLMSGLFTMLFGWTRALGIHGIWFLLLVQLLGGMFQSTGWPGSILLYGLNCYIGNRQGQKRIVHGEDLKVLINIT